MEVLTKTELRLRLQEILTRIDQGEVFIYPTDTIYGIGCNALKNKSVDRIRKLKHRKEQPFSVIAPSIEWIEKNCVTTKKNKEYLDQLPGPLTLIIKMQNNISIANNVAPEMKTLGVRFPDHWFSSIVQRLGHPIVTTSTNKTGRPFMTSLEDLDPEIKDAVDFIIYEGEKRGRASKIIDLVKRKITKR